MISVREKVFETNSSACHALTVIPQKDLEDFAKNRCHKCIYFPDTGEYQTSNYYQIMEIEDAFKQYNRDHEKPNAHYREKRLIRPYCKNLSRYRPRLIRF